MTTEKSLFEDTFGIDTSDHEGHPPKQTTKHKQMLNVDTIPVAQGCVNRLDEIVELVNALILVKMIEKVSRRTSNEELIPSKEEDADKNKIDLSFGENRKIHEEVDPPNDSTIEIFVPYGVPTIV